MRATSRALEHLRALDAEVPRRTMELLLGALLVLNLFDGVLTLLWVSAGITEEANPLMEAALAMHPALFMAAKLALVSLAAILMLRHRALPGVPTATVGLIAVYYWIGLNHAWFFGAAVIPAFY